MSASEKPSEPSPTPVSIVVHKQSRLLEIAFADGRAFKLPFEYLRVYSPSAEVRGHGPGQETLQVGKRLVGLDTLEPVGHYAVQPRFSDGHDTGIYTWEYLYRLGRDQARMWQDYLDRLSAAGASRDPEGFAPAGQPVLVSGTPGTGAAPAGGQFNASAISRPKH